MIEFIKGEVYRLFHKKSFYIYFGSLIFAYILIALIRSGGFKESSVLSDAANFFWFFPPFVGGFLFSAIYTDDLNSKNLIALVGFGMGKAKIVLSKIVIIVLFGSIIFSILPLIHCAIYALFGWMTDGHTLFMIYTVSLKYLLMTIAFSTISGILVYGFQKTTFAIVLYVLLSVGTINILLEVIADFLEHAAPNLVNHLMNGITDRIIAGMIERSPNTSAIIEYVVYILIALIVSIVAFNKKEMEF